ncbi:hypothetical protein M501DRAFT_924143 [Patellaria atrata CBS 101060]|uniref:Zn(2)-C6 fungal-type domain-containing protein n=1 Tax=Patellaria atrata CBS 101060 TaxID=1346257 RepID=A0A9P4SI83_9PEZI|nr:hypothetical protein M501DRAFT_924143 [Patellaria atrata CBS 101060]
MSSSSSNLLIKSSSGKESGDNGSSENSRGDLPGKGFSKRGRITIVACISCRKRKTKCDGRRPSCSQCEIRGGHKCEYDMTDEQRSLTYLREDSNRLVQDKNILETLIDVLQHESEEESNEVLRRLRNQDADMYHVAQQVIAGRALSNVRGESSSTPPRPSSSNINVKGGGIATMGRNVRQFEDHPKVSITVRNWTAATEDHEVLRQRLSCYFSWQHSLFQSFPEDLFWDDLALSQSKHCSRLLVNAVCAAGSLLTARRGKEPVSTNPCWRGQEFYEEAVTLLQRDEISSIPTITALYLLCYVEGHLGNLSSQWLYNGRSGRMALDMRLHLRIDHLNPESSSETNAEEMFRLHAFWGSFIADQVTSISLGRLPQIPLSAITVDLPPIDTIVDDEPWIADGMAIPCIPGARSTTFHQVASLSKIVNSMLQLFFAPRTIISGASILLIHTNLLDWYRNLPPIIARVENAPAHVLCLHAYFHLTVLHLFRPFLKAKFDGSDISPQDICRRSANTISDLFARHLSLYGTNGIYTFHIHCLLAACTVHIINIPAIGSTDYLTAACNAFQELSSRIPWARHALEILRDLVEKWKTILPQEADRAMYGNDERPQPVDGEEFRPEKRQRLDLRPSYLFAPVPDQPPPLLGPIHTGSSVNMDVNDTAEMIRKGFEGLSFTGDDWSVEPFM